MFVKTNHVFYVFFLCGCITICSSAILDPNDVRDIRECLIGKNNYTMVCLKEKALRVLNATVTSNQNLRLFNLLDIVKDPEYVSNDVEDGQEVLSQDASERSLQLNGMLRDKVDEFITSRIVKFNLGHIMEEIAHNYLLEEYKPQKNDGITSKLYKTIILETLTSDGRGKKDKKGGMLMMGGLAMAGMMAQLFMGKIAFMAGAALLVAKLALLLSTIIGFKKLSSGGGGHSSGGESKHVVYSEPVGYGHSHGGGGGGGWHRSIANEEQELESDVGLPYGGYTHSTPPGDGYNYYNSV